MLVLQEALDARVRKREEAKLLELRSQADQHKRAEVERKYAQRYHKARLPFPIESRPAC